MTAAEREDSMRKFETFASIKQSRQLFSNFLCSIVFEVAHQLHLISFLQGKCLLKVSQLCAICVRQPVRDLPVVKFGVTPVAFPLQLSRLLCGLPSHSFHFRIKPLFSTGAPHLVPTSVLDDEAYFGTSDYRLCGPFSTGAESKCKMIWWFVKPVFVPSALVIAWDDWKRVRPVGVVFAWNRCLFVKRGKCFMVVFLLLSMVLAGCCRLLGF